MHCTSFLSAVFHVNCDEAIIQQGNAKQGAFKMAIQSSELQEFQLTTMVCSHVLPEENETKMDINGK